MVPYYASLWRNPSRRVNKKCDTQQRSEHGSQGFVVQPFGWAFVLEELNSALRNREIGFWMRPSWRDELYSQLLQMVSPPRDRLGYCPRDDSSERLRRVSPSPAQLLWAQSRKAVSVSFFVLCFGLPFCTQLLQQVMHVHVHSTKYIAQKTKASAFLVYSSARPVHAVKGGINLHMFSLASKLKNEWIRFIFKSLWPKLWRFAVHISAPVTSCGASPSSDLGWSSL